MARPSRLDIMKRRSRVFRVLGDPTKYVALRILSDSGEMTVSELTNKLAGIGIEIGQPAGSHLTAILEQEGAITKERDGKSMICKVIPEFFMGLDVFGAEKKIRELQTV